jgi:hypothetical protein
MLFGSVGARPADCHLFLRKDLESCVGTMLVGQVADNGTSLSEEQIILLQKDSLKFE